MTRIARRAATAATLIAVLGGGAATVAAESAQASTTAASGTGSGTLTVAGAFRTRTTPAAKVTCTVAGGHYELSAGGQRGMRRLLINMNVPGYTGAGSYTSSVHVLAQGPYGHYARTFTVPVTLTAAGGSATVTRTLPGTVYPGLAGKTATLSASWTCTP